MSIFLSHHKSHTSWRIPIAASCRTNEEDDMMSKHLKSGVLQALVLLMVGLFMATLSGCCPGGPGCDWYSSDHDKQEQPKKE